MNPIRGPVRVAFLTHEPFHPPSGGGSAEAIYLVREFVARGHSVHLFCPDFPDREAVAERFGVTLHPFTRWKMGRYTRLRNLKYLLYPSALAAQVLKVDRDLAAAGSTTTGAFDLLFAQHTISAVAAGRLRSRLGIPAVFNFLDYLTGFMETWPAWVMPGPVVRALTRFELGMPKRFSADGILTVSTPLAERFAATGFPAERIRAIQYGYDATLFKPAPATSAETRSDAARNPVIVMHGSFDQHHLGPIAAVAIQRVVKTIPNAVFRFVGRETPALRHFISALRTKIPGIRIELTGFVPYESVPAHLINADVGMVPYEESNGTHCAFVAKAVEYLGCGIPVASTPLENLRRYFADEPAIRFSGFDGESFARTILEILQQPKTERTRAGLAASVRVARELDWSQVTGSAVDFVERVAREKRNKLGSAH